MTSTAEPDSPLRSRHTRSFAEILRQFAASVLVTTYQAGKLVVLRPEPDADVINTHFRNFPKPMGLAVANNRFSMGTKNQIWEFHNVPAVADRVESCDACYLPRRMHVTGDVSIHEMAYCDDDLWFVNTRFSCLCCYEDAYSFVPRWRPKFISALTPHDRCHLNGIAVADNQVRYATALGATDEPRGWRDNKRNGGVVLDVISDEVIARNLSMPHSPRWHNDQLWILESGTGSLGTVCLKTGSYEKVIELPGFTRGLDFLGGYAFVGLSQVRESAMFSGLPITESKNRVCGVWIVDLARQKSVGFLEFEDSVQEIFAVSVLSHSRYPEVEEPGGSLLDDSFVLPDHALKDVPKHHSE